MVDAKLRRNRTVGGVAMLAIAAVLVGVSLVISQSRLMTLAIGLMIAPILGWVAYRSRGLISVDEAKRRLSPKWMFLLEALGLYVAVALVVTLVPEQWFGSLGLALAGGLVGVALKLLVQGGVIESEFPSGGNEPRHSGE